MLRLACVTLLAFACAAGCSKESVPASGAAPNTPGADEAFTAEKVKELIPEAAGTPSEEFQKLSREILPVGYGPPNGDSLTWVVPHRAGPAQPATPTSLKFLGDPTAVEEAISGPKD